MENKKKRMATPSWVPMACGLLTLVAAVAWDEAAIIAGFAAVALWGPATTVAGAVHRVRLRGASAGPVHSATR